MTEQHVPQKTKSLVDIRRDFPILSRKVHNKPLVYLDNAATTQKPKAVIDIMSEYYERSNANVHRGIHKLSEEATVAYETAHKKASEFINAKGMQEIIFTRNTTESLNLLAHSLAEKLKQGDEIVLSQLEHHSNLVPWFEVAKKTGATIKYIEIDSKGNLLPNFDDVISENTKIVSIGHVSNAIGTINPVKEIVAEAHKNGALAIIDGAQSAPHMHVDMQDLNCDFFAFSGHKMLGPTGSGVLYGKKELLETMSPFQTGGGMIKRVTFESAQWNELPWKFEAGTPAIAEGLGLAAALDYLSKIGMNTVIKHEKELTAYAIQTLSQIPGVTLLGPQNENQLSIVSFTVDKIHPHDLASIVDQEGVAIRAGHHCAMPLMEVLKVNATARASLYLYNTHNDIDTLAQAIQKAQKVFGYA